jgi:hypothetical protein
MTLQSFKVQRFKVQRLTTELLIISLKRTKRFLSSCKFIAVNYNALILSQHFKLPHPRQPLSLGGPEGKYMRLIRFENFLRR